MVSERDGWEKKSKGKENMIKTATSIWKLDYCLLELFSFAARREGNAAIFSLREQFPSPGPSVAAIPLRFARRLRPGPGGELEEKKKEKI